MEKDISLPDGWTWVTIGEVAKSINPGFPSGQHNKEGVGVPHIRPMNISRNGDVDLSVVKYVKPKEYSPLIQGDVLFNNTNSPELVGKTTYIRQNTNWAYSNHMTRIRVRENVVFSGWLANVLHYLFLNGYFKLNCRHHVNQASVSSGFLAEKVSIPLPPLPEQERIVAKIEELFTQLEAGTAALRSVQAGLKRYKASVLKAACEGRLVAHDPEDEPALDMLWRLGKLPIVGENLPSPPEGWCWTRVKDVGYVQLGRQRAPQHHEGPYMRPYLRVANVFEDRIDTTDIKRMNFAPQEYEIYRLEYGDILLNEGQSPELLGRPAMYRNEVPGACFQNTLIRFRASNAILPEYALCIFRAYMHIGRFREESQITTNIAHLSAGRFAKIEFPIPPLAEQGRIVAEVERQMSLASKVETAVKAGLKRADRLRQSVLKRAFEGKLVEQNLEDEPVEALLERIWAEKEGSNMHSATSKSLENKPKPKRRKHTDTKQLDFFSD